MRAVDNALTEGQINARTDRVRSLVRHNGWQDYRVELERLLALVEKEILSGKLDDESYRRYCGRREGLVSALAAPATLIDDEGESDAGGDQRRDD